ncbi:hypothetical protein QF032_005629 [Streptomyces achromogenes]|uniref:hypothetical protein n=1 Tax=Streptomyces achromogenes TaxID=67255 RepID=UPI00277E6E60|nr:hypothetical protein [Streptomyces achromogenes]MDQ0833785.1 hypothetical protein [Streptomyces achromogenes]
MRKNTKIIAFGATTLTLAFGGWFSYQEYFTNGLDSLPDRVCDQSVQRETVIHILPDSRSAQVGSGTNGSGYSFMYSCHIYGDGDSILSGEVQIQNSSQRSWENYYKSYGGKSEGLTEQTSSDRIYALSKSDFASVYAPCVPTGKNPGKASQAYALVSEVRVIGESRATGVALHQALTDFAYGLTRHAYTAGKCKNIQDFPDELPRYREE